MGVIERYGGTAILDPFCGRGTTNLAARLNGIYSIGIDSSEVAYAISSAKMVEVTADGVMAAYDSIVAHSEEEDVPVGDFWSLMYNPLVLKTLCKIRSALLEDCKTPERIALRGIILGALHGPLLVNGSSSYLSNQFPRTYASKPDYSVRYWKKVGLTHPPNVNVRDVVMKRAYRCYSELINPPKGFIIKGDSTEKETFEKIKALNGKVKFDTVITSPPYHGISTYIPDQWVRNWFVGGPDRVEYTTRGQATGDIRSFINQLNAVWSNCGDLCSDGTHMFVRFGEIGDKSIDPAEIIHKTFDGTFWKIDSVVGAGAPKKGRRSCSSFLKSTLHDYREIDVQAILISD